MFEEERGSLVHYVGTFDGFHCAPATCTVRFENTNTPSSQSASTYTSYAAKIAIRQDDVNVSEHPHFFGRGETVHDECAHLWLA
ncbi:hypothetical protein ACC761_14630 [Rhizobium ruizarguesonis]|uniref:Uncharacterized protein n=1 Tax=Rhizobium ruizarguesonis TaxID=2081791 RepID=A0AB38HR41_9HYPH|nr:hypothetical protein [Rhizobium ruizarguesonis]TBC01441.1 hypothetical protein ELH40_38320 [Rhizobium ruizarguesonis]